MTFAEDFLIHRRRAGLNQTDAAHLLDIGVRTLYSWEQGEVVPHPLMQVGAFARLAAVVKSNETVKLQPLGGPGPASERVITPETLEEPLRSQQPLKASLVNWSTVDWRRPPFQIAQDLGIPLSTVLKNKPNRP